MPPDLIEMLSYRRPHKSESENEFIERFIDPLGCIVDKFGNRIKVIGKTEPRILFSAHTDTVHRKGGRQNIWRYKDTDLLCTNNGAPLGADDGAGCYVLITMIQAGIPGLYVFHRGEEIGGLGSSYIRNNTPKLLNDIDAAIAFDRRGTTDIIHKQMCGDCASLDFVESLSKQLNLNHHAARGSFTDTANYIDLVPECSNVSVGYYHEHSHLEVLDTKYLKTLIAALKKVDWSRLIIERTPASDRPTKPVASTKTKPVASTKTKPVKPVANVKPLKEIKDKPTKYLPDLVQSFPNETADMLDNVLNVSYEELRDYIESIWNTELTTSNLQ